VEDFASWYKSAADVVKLIDSAKRLVKPYLWARFKNASILVNYIQRSNSWPQYA